VVLNLIQFNLRLQSLVMGFQILKLGFTVATNNFWCGRHNNHRHSMYRSQIDINEIDRWKDVKDWSPSTWASRSVEL